MFRILLPLMLMMAVVLVVYLAVEFSRTRLSSGGGDTAVPRTPSVPAVPPQDPFADLPDPGGDPRELRVGDMVDYSGERSWVRGTVRISGRAGDTDTWAMHLLEMPDTKRWLSVPEEAGADLMLWSPLPGGESGSGSDTVTVEGTSYRLQARGSGIYHTEGTTGQPPNGTVDYARYAAADGRGVLFERYDGGNWRVGTGTPVRRESLVIFPRS